jgi:hypothetical protein
MILSSHLQAVGKIGDRQPISSISSLVKGGSVGTKWVSVPDFPKGAITEVSGVVSSGRTAVLHSVLAEATQLGECCAVVDALGAFDPLSAAQAGVELRRLLWVRTNGNPADEKATPLERAVKSADLILHAGGFGVIVLDLCEVANRDLNTIPLSYWYRFRRAVENTPKRLVVACHVPLVKACARLSIVTHCERIVWKGSTPLFSGIEFEIETRKQRVALAS